MVSARTGSLELQRYQPTRFLQRNCPNLPFRVKNPVQNPTTHPRTIEKCSSASNEPRTSGGLISAMYKGESILRAIIGSSGLKGYDEETGEDIPERADAETADCPSSRDLREGLCPRLQGRTNAENDCRRNSASRPNTHRMNTHHTQKQWTPVSKPYLPTRPRQAHRKDTLAQAQPL